MTPKMIKIDAEVESTRKVGDVYQVSVYVGDYQVFVYMTPAELNAAMGVKSF